MSDKQLGAAPEAKPESQRAPGWAGRLRAQPGFPAAAVAFFLTVILGIGGPAAYAYWSQSTTVTVTGTTAKPVTPVPAVGKCENVFFWGARMTLPGQPTADPEARFILTFQSAQLKSPLSLALPQNARTAQTVQPIELGLDSALGTTGGRLVDVTVTVQTAILKSPKTSVAPVTTVDYAHPPSGASVPTALSYVTTERYGIPSIACKSR